MTAICLAGLPFKIVQLQMRNVAAKCVLYVMSAYKCEEGVLERQWSKREWVEQEKPKHCMNEWNNENEKICRHKLNFLFASLIWLFSFMCNVISVEDACFTLLSVYWPESRAKSQALYFFHALLLYIFLHYPHTMQIRSHYDFHYIVLCPGYTVVMNGIENLFYS